MVEEQLVNGIKIGYMEQLLRKTFFTRDSLKMVRKKVMDKLIPYLEKPSVVSSRMIIPMVMEFKLH
jgi:hypothetical protein